MTKKKNKAGASSPPPKAPSPAQAPSPSSPSAEQREHPRIGLGLLVQVRASSLEEFKAVHCENISLGGMFLRTPERRPLGTEIFFQLTLENGGALIEGLARVVRTTDTGLGIQFVSLLEPSALIVKKLVEARLAAER